MRKATTKPQRHGTRTNERRKARASNHRVAGMPQFIEPQLATLVTNVPQGRSWLHEIKLDGFRIFCRIENGKVAILTRNAQDWTDRLGVVARAAKELPVRGAIIDGEVVAVESDGTHSFQRLQNALGDGSARLIYYAFDLLHLDGRDLRAAPLLERKRTLQSLLSDGGKTASIAIIRYSEHRIGGGQELFAKACEIGLEGIVSKRVDDPYRSGRTRSWVKIKCSQNQEFVIGGFTDPAGARLGFGALLLGVYEENGALRYAGRVGTGFDDRFLRDLLVRLKKLERRSTPFQHAPRGANFRGVHWVEPELVCEVAFSGWTTDGLLRHPSFKGLREDKAPVEVTREVAVPAASASAKLNAGDRIAGIQLTHPDRILYPEQGVTKRELAQYYEQIADWILPHLSRRPLSLVRCPAGYDKECFYQRHPRETIKEPVHSIAVREKGRTVHYLSLDSLAGLIALVQMGALELHTWGSCAPSLEYPDRVIFDLDPAPEMTWEQLRQGAEHLRARLGKLDLGVFVKTTGGKGLHIVVPITPTKTWNIVKNFSRAIAESIVREAPEQFIATMSKARRRGKIFIDYLRNNRTATAVSAYSPRARSGATVSMPLRWEDLDKDMRTQFTIRNAPEHLALTGDDPWQDYNEARRPLTEKLLRELH